MSGGPVAYLCFTAAGAATARRLVRAGVVGCIYGKCGRVAEPDEHFDDAGGLVRRLFVEGTPIVGLCATGVLVRLLAPVLGDKRAEPAVLAISEDGAAVVPILGGHHGANDLARRCADLLETRAAVTTAGDRRLGFSFDAPLDGWTLATPELVKPVTAALLAGEAVSLSVEAGDGAWPPPDIFTDGPSAYRVLVTDRAAQDDGKTLILHPPTLAVGIGAERLIQAEEGVAALRTVLDRAGLAPSSVAAIGSIDIKRDEPAVLAAADSLGRAPRFFPAEALEREAPRLANASDIVYRETGCHGVAEGAALALAGPDGALAVEKQKIGRVTIAIARAPSIPPDQGSQNGALFVVGTGAGDPVWRTGEAVAALRQAEVVVGYDLYLELVADLIAGKETIATPLGEERARAAKALEIAAQGRRVALLGSGDPGIYALATLVHEILEDATDRAMRGVAVTICPGISAFQAAAARLGAPMGHDFCLISLSDLLTPVEAIRARLKAAAEGDFVTAFYNPQSQRRRSLLGEARDTFLKERPADTPVAVCRNLGREGETTALATLGAFDPAAVDMLSLVIFGNSETRRYESARGPRLYTPRGYGRKSTGQNEEDAA